MFEIGIVTAVICVGITIWLAEKYKVDGDGNGPCCAG